jgi:putative polyhydroxyalkanoate system protein
MQMPDIKIHRKHRLGLTKARKIAWKWAEHVEQRFDMECTVLEGDAEDTVEFRRIGVNGTLTVAADRFDLHARLGLLLGAFSKTIEAEIERNLDALLEPEVAASKAAATKAAAKKAAAKEAAAKEAPAKAAKKARKARSG